MFGPAPRRGPSTASEWIISGIFLALILGLFGAEIYQNYRPAKLSALLVILFWIPLLALHEGGHAAAAFVLGWRVRQIVIGMGKAVARFSLGSARVEVRLIPVEGFVQTVPTKIRLPRLESAFIYLAGPGVELLLALGILSAVGPDRLLRASEEYALILWQSLALAAAAQAVLNLIPFAVQERDRAIYSDGLGLLVSFLRPIGYYERMIAHEAERQERENDSYRPVGR